MSAGTTARAAILVRPPPGLRVLAAAIGTGTGAGAGAVGWLIVRYGTGIQPGTPGFGGGYPSRVALISVLLASAAMAVASWAAGALLTFVTARLHQLGRHPARRAWVTAGLDAAHRGHWRNPAVSWSCVR